MKRWLIVTGVAKLIWDPKKSQGNLDMTVPEQGGAEYIGTFNGHRRDW